MSSTTVNTELRDFQAAVKAKIAELRGTVYYHGFDQIERDLGLDTFVPDVEVTVKVTVPADDAASATAQVESQIASLYLPTGWSAAVSS
jgi:hypothetical protein